MSLLYPTSCSGAPFVGDADGVSVVLTTVMTLFSAPSTAHAIVSACRGQELGLNPYVQRRSRIWAIAIHFAYPETLAHMQHDYRCNFALFGSNHTGVLEVCYEVLRGVRAVPAY